MSQAITLSSKNLAGWAPHFGADFMAQALKGAGWILGFPALVASARGIPDPGTALRLGVPITQWQEPAYALLAQPWMPALGLLGVLALLLRSTARSRREAWATAGLLLALLTYPVVQFSTRHIFLDPGNSFGSSGCFPCPALSGNGDDCARSCPASSWRSSVALGLIAIVYAGLCQLQQRWLASDFADLLALPRERVTVSRNLQDDGAVMLHVPCASHRRRNDRRPSGTPWSWMARSQFPQ